METLKEVSEAMAGVVEGAGESVVRVEARRRLPASGVIWSEEGVIVTAHHVVQRSENIRVGIPHEESIPAKLVGRDASTDLAVLRVEAAGLKPPKWSGAEELKVGHLVLALGRPGRSIMATMGIVSAWSEAWRTPAGGELSNYLQTDVVMYPGFSGGLLVDAKGEALGLNTSALLRGVSMTVPGPSMHAVVGALLEHGRVRRGYLGVSLQPVRLPSHVSERLGRDTALLVVSVEEDSPASRGGLLLGDTITAFDENPVRQLDDLMSYLSEAEVEAQVTLQILRGGELQQLELRLGERGEGG